MVRFITSLLLFLAGATAVSATASSDFPRVILPGDYPDPTILRDGEDYYMTHSPFRYAPGFLIWHSRDLVNWEPITRAIPEYTGSAMAPDLVKHNGRYYIYFPSDGTNWVSWADDIRGPWSTPVDLKVKGIDPGHIADRDGNRYLYVNEGEVVPLAPDGLSTIGGKTKVYDGWKYPSSWETEGMYLESPKLLYHNGYYYLTSAEGGTAGPATSHMAVSARSRNVTGPWENSPYNPLVHTYRDSDHWWSKGHGTIIDDVNGNWWIVYHGYPNNFHTLGRATLIEPLELTPDGWFRPTASAQLPGDTSAGQPIKNGMELSDSFDSPTLGLQWTMWGENPSASVTCGESAIKVKGKGRSSDPASGRLLLVTPQHKNYITEAEISVGKGASAGLLLYYSDKAFAGLMCDGKRFTIYSSPTAFTTVPDSLGRNFHVRLHNNCNHLSVSVSADGDRWTTLATGIDVNAYHHNNYGGFFALRPALCVAGKGEAKFSSFGYRDAVPQEKDMSAYLMVFHKDDTHSLHMALSRDGYIFTALNDGRPIIAGDTIADQKGIRDPHIYRGPDGAFYLAMTDLHVFAKDAGFRDTEWERDGKKYGWGNNRGLVLMKSHDLIHWTRSNVRFDELSREYAEVGCVWAPETIYDPETGKLMIYFTMRFGNEMNRLYYAYVDDAFSRLDSRPALLFEYPDGRSTAIDGDLTRVRDKYHLFYVAHTGTPGIKHATSGSVNSSFAFSPEWIDPEPSACEAPNVWKRIGEDKWVLMYDCYGIKTHNFGFVETSDFKTFTPLGHFNEGVMKTTNFTSPKHGAVIHLTAEEADQLENHWKKQ